MSKTILKNKRIRDLVDQDSVHAYVLYYLGIRFYEYGEQTLEQVCRDKGMKVEQVISELEFPNANFKEADLPLIQYPIDLIVEYLKHTHYIFVKHKLPYISRLVETFKAEHENYKMVERDLKLLFPLFLEDFIHHIYDEEDNLFRYIGILERASKGTYNPAQVYYLMERNSLQKFAMEHEAHDDEMEGIRRITKEYYLHKDAPLHVKVLYSELIAFESSLKTHARIENEILFPKAMMLENKVKVIFEGKIKFN